MPNTEYLQYDFTADGAGVTSTWWTRRVLALRSVAGRPAATSLMHPWSEISMRNTLIHPVGGLEPPGEGRVLLRPWPYPADAQPLWGKVFPRFPQLYTCQTCTPVIISARSSYAKSSKLITHLKCSHFIFAIYSDSITSISLMHLKYFLNEI